MFCQNSDHKISHDTLSYGIDNFLIILIDNTVDNSHWNVCSHSYIPATLVCALLSYFAILHHKLHLTTHLNWLCCLFFVRVSIFEEYGHLQDHWLNFVSTSVNPPRRSPPSQLILLLCRVHRSHSDSAPESLAGSSPPNLLLDFPLQPSFLVRWRFFSPTLQVADIYPGVWSSKIRQVYDK